MTAAPDTALMEELDLAMTNFDGVIDDGLAEALQARPGEVFGEHYGWNFYGKVYFFDGKFHEEVWYLGAPRETVSADSLRELMNAVCEDYGYERRLTINQTLSYTDPMEALAIGAIAAFLYRWSRLPTSPRIQQCTRFLSLWCTGLCIVVIWRALTPWN